MAEDLWTSFKPFIWGVIKRGYWLFVSLVTDPFDIAERVFNMTYEPPTWTFGLLLGIAVFIAGFLTYHDLRKEVQVAIDKPITVVKNVLQSKRKMRHDDWIVKMDLCSQMYEKHGHSDDSGIVKDILDGIDTNEILQRNCTKCGKPRNQESGYY